MTIQQLSLAAGSTLIRKVLAAEGIERSASAQEVTIAIIANFAILLDKILGLAVGVINFHDVEVENGEGLQHDSIGVRPIGKDSCESAVKSGEEQLVIKRMVSVVVVDSKASDDLSLRKVVAVVVEQVGA